MIMAKRLSSRQWYAAKARMQRSGTWDEEKYKLAKAKFEKELDVHGHQTDASEGSSFHSPHTSDTEIYTPPDTPAAGKHLMSNYVSDKPISDISSGNNSITGDNYEGEILKTSETPSEIHMEMSNKGKRKVPNSHVSSFSKRGNFHDKTSKVEGTRRSFSISCGAFELGGVRGVSSSENYLRDNMLIMQKDKKPFYWKDIQYNEYGKVPVLEDYFMSYNSIGVVIKCLPDESFNTYDMYLELCKNISDPFVIITERSENNVLHWHMIWLTSKRSDNAKRLLQKYLLPISSNFSIACEQTRSLKNLVRYILKQPLCVGVANSEYFMKYVYALCQLDQVYNKKTPDVVDGTSNTMIKDILNVMKSKHLYTYEELLRQAPEIMVQYLHKPNLESIVQNCKLFLLQPSNILNIFNRLLHTDTPKCHSFFKFWCILRYQLLPADEFLLDFMNIFCRIPKKHNVLCLQGPSNAGKSAFFKPLFEIANPGEIVAGGQFMFQNCINKDILVWEEPLIGSDYVEMCKRVFEGMSTQVPVKFRAPQTLHRTPIFITTNKDVWYYCSGDESALRNRMILYPFDYNATLITTRAPSFWKQCFESYYQFCSDLSRYLLKSEPDSGTGLEFDQPERTSRANTPSERVDTTSEPGSPVVNPSSPTILERYDTELLDLILNTPPAFDEYYFFNHHREYNERRHSSSPIPDLFCTESPGSPSDDSSTTDYDRSRPSATTGDSTDPGTTASTTITLYRRLASERRDFRLGGPRPYASRRDPGRLRIIQENCDRLHTNLWEWERKIEKILNEPEVSVDFDLVWPFTEQLSTEDWKQFLETIYFIGNTLNAFSNISQC